MSDLDELVNELNKKEYDYTHRTGKRPRVVIFIGYSCYITIMSRIMGRVTMVEEELYHRNTIQGYKVYRVPELDTWEILVE